MAIAGKRVAEKLQIVRAGLSEYSEVPCRPVNLETQEPSSNDSQAHRVSDLNFSTQAVALICRPL